MIAYQHIIEIRDSERERRAELRRREDREKRMAEMNRSFTAPVRTVHPATSTKTNTPIVSRPTTTDDDDITRRSPLTDINNVIPFIDFSAPSTPSSDYSSPSDSSSSSTDFGGSDSGFSGGGGGSDW